MREKQPSAEQLITVTAELELIFAQAGRAILDRYHLPDHQIQTKADQSPVTDADLASHDILIEALSRITPTWPVISEEDAIPAQLSSDFVAIPPSSPYWLLDPLDGTKEFISRTGEFSINLGLVIGDQAVFGLLFAPVTGVLYRGGLMMAAERRHLNDEWIKIQCRSRPRDGGVVISSRRSASAPDAETFARRDHLGSALKFGRIAEGNADVYLRRGPTMEWDTCAGQAIVEAAGGTVLTLDQQPLRYGKENRLNPGFVVRGCG
jgi:3'(2'), 5'-bisphosphate nucleotidase